MTLLSPGFLLAGVLAVAVPIVIFLLWRQRRMPVQFAAMRFLLEAERKHHRRLRLERWLLLAIRCLALVALGAALARPILESAGVLPGANRAVVVMLDDSMTASLRGPDGTTALDRHRDAVRELLDGLEPGDRVGVVTLSRATADLLPPSSDVARVRRWLDELEPRPLRANLPDAMEAFADAARIATAEGFEPSAYLLSEFRAGSADLDDVLPDLGLPPSVPLRAVSPAVDLAANVTVAGIDPVRSVIVPGAADGSGQIAVRLVRHGDLAASTSRVTVEAEGVPPLPAREVRWAPGQTTASVEFRLAVDPGTAQSIAVRARVDDDDLAFDDAAAIVLEARPALRVAILARGGFGSARSLDRLGAGEWFERALMPGADGAIEVRRLEPAAVVESDLRDVDVAILPRADLVRPDGWDAIEAFGRRGGVLIVTPPDELTVHPWGEALAEAVAADWTIDRATTVLDVPVPIAAPRVVPTLLGMLAAELEELAQPVFVARLLAVEPGPRTETVLALDDGRPLLVASWMGSGRTDGAGPRASAPVLGTDDATGSDGRLDPVRPASGNDPDDAATGDGRGGLVIYLAAAPTLDWTNLPSKPLMVPLVQELVRQGLGLARGAGRLQVGTRPRLVRFPAAETLLGPSRFGPSVRPIAGGTETGGTGGAGASAGSAATAGPAARLPIGTDARPVDPIDVPGIHTVLDVADRPIGVVAVSLDIAGGRTEVQDAETVSNWLGRSGDWRTIDAGTASEALQADGGGSALAAFLLVVLLILLVAETLLGRRFSHLVAGRAGERGTAVGSILPSMSAATAGGVRARGGRS